MNDFHTAQCPLAKAPFGCCALPELGAFHLEQGFGEMGLGGVEAVAQLGAEGAKLFDAGDDAGYCASQLRPRGAQRK